MRRRSQNLLQRNDLRASGAQFPPSHPGPMLYSSRKSEKESGAVRAWQLTIVGGVRERSVCPRRGRGRDCAPAALGRALLGGPSTSPLGGPSVTLPLLAFLAFLALFALSVLTLSYVQCRIITRSGWKPLQVNSYRALKQLYWDNLSTPQRWLIWPGILCFVAAALGAILSLLWQRFAAS
jgi:hypothetical protein